MVKIQFIVYDFGFFFILRPCKLCPDFVVLVRIKKTINYIRSQYPCHVYLTQINGLSCLEFKFDNTR